MGPDPRTAPHIGRFLAPAVVILAALWAWTGLDADLSRIGRAPAAAAQVVRDMIPAHTDAKFLARVWAGLLETLRIAILSTLAGFAMSLPIGLLAARNLFPAWITIPLRLVAAAVRVLPSILWAILAVLVFGFGPLAGVVAMAFYTVGYLTKLQYEAYEGLQRDSLDAVRAMGASRLQVAWHVVLPESGNSLRSQLLFMFEYNVRNSTIIGVVGAGGIGMLLTPYLQFAQYDRILTILLFMFATVVLIDSASYLIRRRFLELEEGPSRRATWQDVLMPWRNH